MESESKGVRGSTDISVDVTRCVGCLSCALNCSMRFEGCFNPYYSKIHIVPPDRSENVGLASIAFTNDCDGCGICVRSCLYGALASNSKKN